MFFLATILLFGFASAQKVIKLFYCSLDEHNLRMDCKYALPAGAPEPFCKYTNGDRLFDTTDPDEEQHAPFKKRAKARIFPGNNCRLLFKNLPNGKSNFTCNIKYADSTIATKTSVVEKRQTEDTFDPLTMTPSTTTSSHWTLSELLGQRRLLGLGALLAWLVLFHLLVNVWLLCIFTSLLVVLGGWLGSRALLDADSLLHLEHFLPLGKINTPLYSPEHEWRLNHEIHNAVHKAVRDFVSSWYRTLMPEVEGEFERAVCDSMLESVMELKERARRVDRKALFQRLLELYGRHLQSYMTARQIQSTQKESISLWKLYSEVDALHPAVSSATTELSYSRALVNLVLHVLVPYPQMETRTGGYMVTELITCNVMLPLINRLSDPDWLNQTIVDIITKSREPQETNVDKRLVATLYKSQIQQESWTTCRSCSCSSDQASLTSKSTSELDDVQSQTTLCETDSSQNSSSLVSGHHSTSSESKIISMDSLTQSDLEDDLREGFCDCGPPTNFYNRITLKDDETVGCFRPLKNLGPKVVVAEESQWPTGIAQEKSPKFPPRRLCLTSCNFDASNNQVAPVNIQNVQISGTVTAKEQRGTGTHPYTLYTVKFETVAEAEDGGTLQPASCHTVNRRYSEFLNLQTRLEEKPEVKKVIKNVKGPKKMFPDLSFGNADSDKVEARKTQLDTFLKQLSSIPETSNSEDMQEFLALNSDVCTYFGRKPFVKSRIDKMMENALDTLKTAFPHPEPLSPTEDLEGDADGRTMDNRKYRRLMFPSKISPSLNIPDLHPKVTYCFSEGSAGLNGMTLSGLESFVKEQERLLCGSNGKEAAEQSCKRSRKDKTTSGKSHGAGVAHLTSAPCWVIYLQVLQEAVWPGGTLPVQPRPERSAAEQEETKEQCLDCLMQLLPELITDVLGSEKYRLTLETMLESLQDHWINKHLIFCICELLLEFLIPESCDEDFQRSLLLSLAKDNV
ncbi:Sorting nexin-19 [Larimichthys crocea]|uniref:Sorting nexin-19 n=1 Tax=Larimichthys crocea TaxID=215358 RepID=A0A6G0I9G1_LARCR|nr:Sorting nexin-19 [Larimichthys crocea]